MFKKRKQEDDWEIADGGFFDPEEQFVQSTKKPVKVQENNKSSNKKPTKSEKSSVNEQTYKTKPNSLRKRETDEYEFDSFDDYIVEMDKPKKIAKWKVVLPIVLLSIVIVGFIGYFNTDFDNKGNAYVISLEIHYERKYVKQSDELLDKLLEISRDLDSNTAQLPSNYVNISAVLTEQLNTLKTKTTAFSKYVGVPTKFNSYHSQLINFSLSTQQFIDKLIKNYNDADYEAFRESGLSDYFSSFENLKQARSDIDTIIFRNMEVENEFK